MRGLAKELADMDEVGINENLLMALFEQKTDKLISFNNSKQQFTFEDFKQTGESGKRQNHKNNESFLSRGSKTDKNNMLNIQ